MITNANPNFYERELESYRSATAFRELTIVAAMDFCAEWRLTPPEWLVTEAAALLIELVKSQKAKKRGRAAGYIAQYRQHIWDLERWDATLRVREIRDKTKRELRIVRDCPKLAKDKQTAKLVEHYRKCKRWLRRGTYECASMLTGDSARVGAAAVRRSYRRIQLKNQSGGFRSCVFSDIFIDKIGIGAAQKRDRKWRPIYDLTP
jgi:hypothetical protein